MNQLPHLNSFTLICVLKPSISTFNIVWSYGFAINSWLALFNMLPFWIFDGEKIMAWDMRVWGATAAVAAALVFVF